MPPGSALAVPPRKAEPPAVYVQETDGDIPDAVWCGFIPSGAARPIRRPLTQDERHKLELRRDELRAGLEGFGAHERDDVAAAVAAMFGGFRSMRQQGMEVVALTQSVMDLLRDFPCWAIEAACHKIRIGQAGLSRNFPPNDAEIHEKVTEEVRRHRRTLHTVAGVLNAPVERPVPIVSAPPTPPRLPGDGGHAARVLADLEQRHQAPGRA